SEPEDPLLSQREREVLRLVAAGFSDQRIAEQLVVSPHTVHRHVANIRNKLSCGTPTAPVAEAARPGALLAGHEPDRTGATGNGPSAQMARLGDVGRTGRPYRRGRHEHHSTT